jgi:hypothetical protein
MDVGPTRGELGVNYVALHQCLVIEFHDFYGPKARNQKPKINEPGDVAWAHESKCGRRKITTTGETEYVIERPRSK